MTSSNKITVLLVEDDPMVQEVNRMFVEKTGGFTVIGTAQNGREARQMIRELKPDLVLLDVFMAEEDGVETIRNLRNEESDVDILAVTAANDSKTIKTLLRYGVIDYIVKPFTYERIEKALVKYREMTKQFSKADGFSQARIDSMLKQESLTETKKIDLPKGLQRPTLNQISTYLETIESAQSAEEIGQNVGLARVTAGRYLNYLESVGEVTVTLTYGTIGRPIQLYRLKSTEEHE